jgi:hypothetical protein
MLENIYKNGKTVVDMSKGKDTILNTLWTTGMLTRNDKGCWLLNKDAPFYTRANEDATPTVRMWVEEDEGPNWVSRSIANFGKAIAGEEYYPRRHITHTCGNPFCMNPDHLEYKVPDEIYHSRQDKIKAKAEKPKVIETPKYDLEPGDDVTLTQFLIVTRMTSMNECITAIKEQSGLDYSAIARCRKELVGALFDDPSYTIQELYLVMDMISGLKLAQTNRNFQTALDGMRENLNKRAMRLKRQTELRNQNASPQQLFFTD